MKVCFRRFLMMALLPAALAACGAKEAFPVRRGQPAFDPTATHEVTAVPLYLTPISTPRPLPELPPLLNAQSSKMLALAGDTLVTVNADSGSITLVDIQTERVQAEIPVGNDPRAVAITPDGVYALVTLRGDNALAVVALAAGTLERVVPVGHMPYGVVTNGRRAFVSCFADDEIAVVNLESDEVLYRVPVPDAPAALAISGDWLLSTHLYSGYVTAINVQRTPVVVGSVNVEPDGNLASAIILSPDGRRAYIPQTRTGLALVSLQYMQDWFPVVGVLDVMRLAGDRDARLTVSMLDEAANMPFDAAFDAGGKTLYVVLAGNDAVVAVDPASRVMQARIPVGANPRGIVVDGGRAFVLNALDGTVSIIQTTGHQVQHTIRVTDLPLDALLLRGKVLFHRAGAPVMSDGAISCATCHFDGGADARTWINFRSGPRNTPPLGDAAELPPYNWAGDMAELHDTIEDQIRNVMLGDGLIVSGAFDPTLPQVDAGRSHDLDALAAYVASLEAWPSPYRQPDGSLSESAQRGMMLFLSGSPNCGCHTPPLYTDLQQHNLSGAAFSLETFESFDTPTLRGLWASAPYMHDGVAQTLEEVLTRTDPVHSVAGGLTRQQLDDLIAFLLSL
ncbi:MAG: hypothetical protein HXY41_09285 [Chloroflexi bacterium]|nr:hypothetical protein [Chloroflexota bacterium]